MFCCSRKNSHRLFHYRFIKSCLGKKDLRAQILFSFFIPHRGIIMAKRWTLKSLNTSGGPLVSCSPTCFCLNIPYDRNACELFFLSSFLTIAGIFVSVCFRSASFSDKLPSSQNRRLCLNESSSAILESHALSN